MAGKRFLNPMFWRELFLNMCDRGRQATRFMKQEDVVIEAESGAAAPSAVQITVIHPTLESDSPRVSVSERRAFITREGASK